MSFQLHPKCKSRLVEILTNGIPKALVRNGKFVDYASLGHAIQGAENVLPREVANGLTEQVGESSIIDFTDVMLTRYFKANGKFDENAPPIIIGDLKNIDSAAQAQKIIDQFETLPWRYSFALKIPIELSPVFLDAPIHSFGPTLKVIQATPEFRLKYPMGEDKKPLGLLSGLLFGQNEWDVHAYYLQTEAEGLIWTYGGGPLLENVSAIFSSFFGLGIALGLFSHTYRIDPLFMREKVHVHRIHSNAQEFEQDTEWGEFESKLLRSLRESDLTNEVPNDKRRSWLAYVFGQISTVFSAGQRAAQILLAAKWLYASYQSGDELFGIRTIYDRP